MAQTFYTSDHEWIRVEGETAIIGITDYAQEQLGDIVFVDLPEKGRTIAKGDTVVVVESVKAASDVYAPISGEITDVNDELSANPSLINSAAENEGWLWKMKLADMSEVEGLMDRAAYEATTE